MKYILNIIAYSLLLLFIVDGCSKDEQVTAVKITLVSPENNAEMDYASAILKWGRASEQNATYSLFYGTTNPPESRIDDIVNNSYTLTGLEPETTYYWAITVDGNNILPSNEIRQFKTIPNKSLRLESPVDKSTLEYLYPKLQWELASSTDDVFHVYLDSDTTKWTEVGTTTDQSFVPQQLNWSTKYYWKVKTTTSDNTIFMSNTWSFETPARTQRDYSSYKGLVMAGYQGWFSCEGDGANKGWMHYTSTDGAFSDGYCSIDYWPYVSEYENTYETNFIFSNGEPGQLFSSYDEQTVLTHFKWMEEYGIDGVFKQRFMSEIKYHKERGYKVFASAMKGAKLYNRAMCLMYDGGVGTDDELLKADLLETDGLYDFKNNPNYLKHNGRPLVVLWGIALSSRPDATPEKTSEMIDWLNSQGFSVMLGVDANWRSQSQFYSAFKKADIIHPWFVGRYKSVYNYENNYRESIKQDMDWCKNNNVDYVPTVFPGFSWHNMKPDSPSDYIPREKGDFMWGQMYGNIADGAEMIYVAMFDEIDEGTAIFKCATEVPKKPAGSNANTVFVPYRVEPDHYLWLAGEAGRMLRNELPLTSIQPKR